MTDIANTAQYDAWNGDSGRRWIEDPDRRDRVMAMPILAEVGVDPGEPSVMPLHKLLQVSADQ